MLTLHLVHRSNSTMHMKYFGDSYDLVKQSLLRWLRPFGKWSVHPMFTESVSIHEVRAFERLLNANVISSEVLTVDSDRSAYLSHTQDRGNLFLDPNTGLSLKKSAGGNSPNYLFMGELIHSANARPSSLTLVFDQSLARGSEQEGLEKKLTYLHQKSISGFAYRSHAAFIIASPDRALVARAYDEVIKKSALPKSRFVLTV